MNIHKNARLTFLRRLEMVEDITKLGLSASQVAAAHGVSAVTARKWRARYLANGATGLADKSSRPARSPQAIDPSVALAIVELRRNLFAQPRIATYLGVSKATVSRVLSELVSPDSATWLQSTRFHATSAKRRGDLLHIDIKKLGRFSDVGHRITGDYTKRTRGLDYQYLFVAIDDHARVAFTAMRPDERKDSAEASCERLSHTAPSWAYRCNA